MVVLPALLFIFCSPDTFILLASLSTIWLQLWFPCSYFPDLPFQSCPLDLISTMLSKWVDYHLGIFQLPKKSMFYKRNVLFFLPPNLPTLSNFLLHSCHLCILPSSKSPRPWDLLSHSILLQPSCAVYPQILSNVSLECVWESIPPFCGLYLGLNNRLLLDYCHSFLITFPGIIGNDDNNDNFSINIYYLLII